MQEKIQGDSLPEEKKCCLPCCSCSGWKIIVCVVVGLLVVAGAVYAGYQVGRRSLTPKELLIPPEPIATQIPIDNGPVGIELSLTPSPTANWKTYRNEEYGFSFKYPPEVTLADSNPESHSLQVVGREEKGDPFTFSVYSNKKWSDESLYFRNNPSNGSKTVNGVVWKTFFAPATGGVGPESTPDMFALQTVKKGVFYQIYFTNARDTTGLFDQVLSTFKFLD